MKKNKNKQIENQSPQMELAPQGDVCFSHESADNNICECGHDRDSHDTVEGKIGEAPTWKGFCSEVRCDCEKYIPQKSLNYSILNKCSQEEGYIDYEEFKMLHMDCPRATKIYEKAILKAILETQKEIITKAKEYNGMINSVSDLFEHLDRVQKCSNCKKHFYDKKCLSCWSEIEKATAEKIIKLIPEIRKDSSLDSYGGASDCEYGCLEIIEDKIKQTFLKEKQ